jgi:acyl-coenzyme A thioesterase PaaI-like protein
MANRSKFVFTEILAQVRKLSDLKEDLRLFARHPRSVGALIESRSSWLNRKFLGAASNLVEPFLVGMGFSVASLSEDSVEVTMPGFLRNQGETGVLHNAALSALGEFAARIFWEHHLDLRRQELRARAVSLRLIARAAGQMRAVFRFPVSEREAVLHALRVSGRADADSTISVYDSDGRLVAEVDVSWDFSRQMALGSGGIE